MRTLTARELNRALLALQLLVDRAAVALELMGCLQAQYAPSMYIGLWSRVDGFRRDDLTRALEDPTVVHGTLMRVTIHLVSAADYWPLALAVRQPRRYRFLRATRHRMSAEEVAEAAAVLRERVRERPLRRSEIDALIGKDLAIGAGLWEDFVRVPPSGTWERRRADLYGAAEDWLGPPPADLDVGTATEHLVRRYLSGFGPAAAADVADWGGLRTADVLAVFQRLDLRRFADEDGRELYDPSDALLPDPATPAPVRFLPTWDASLLIHARRKGVTAEEHRPLVFSTKTPHSSCTFLVDGTVAGSWRYEEGEVRLAPFAPLAPAVLAEVEEEAARLAAFHA